MRILVVEDDFVSRCLLCELLAPYGSCHVATDGKEALDAVRRALDAKEPYQLICLDIMMPNMNGQEALRQIRALESERGIMLGEGVKIIMTTALSDAKNILEAFNEQCEAYLVKPITRDTLTRQLQTLGLLEGDPSS